MERRLKNMNLNKMCRTCLMNPGTTSIFDKNHCLKSMLLEICEIEVCEFSEYPMSLCSDCVRRIKDAFLFKQQSKKSTMILENYFNTSTLLIIKKEVESEDNLIEKEMVHSEMFEDDAAIKIEETEYNHDVSDYDNDVLDDSEDVKIFVKTEDNNLLIENLDEISKIRSHEQREIINIETVLENGDVIYECYFCKQKHDSQDDLIDHYKIHDEKMPYVCSVCGKKFQRPLSLNEHVYGHRGLKPYQCEMCGKSFRTKKNLGEHVRYQRKNSKSCGIKGQYANDENSRGNVKPINHRIEINVETITDSGEKIYQCYFCKSVHDDQAQLIAHYKTHDFKHPYVCPYCGLKCRFPFLLNGHVSAHKGEKQFCCDVCGRLYMHKENLKIHYRTHTGVLPYECQDCDKKFKHSTQLVLHRRTHTKEKPYMCPICGLKMAYSSNLVEHIRIHKKEDTFKCTVCDKNFVTKMKLRSHELIHKDQRKHVCDFCNKGFIKPYQLKLHVMTHTGEKLHNCKVCGKGFIQLAPYKSHMRQHGINIVNK